MSILIKHKLKSKVKLRCNRSHFYLIINLKYQFTFLLCYQITETVIRLIYKYTQIKDKI
jgi:hypothetical protein